MIEPLDPRTARQEPTLDFIRENEPALAPIADWSVVRFDKRQQMAAPAYMRYNMSRRSGRAEALLKANSDATFRRVMGTFGMDNPGISVVMGFKKGKCAAFLCIDRIPDDMRANLGTGEGIEDGEAFAETMNVLSVLCGVPCSVIFSLDNWSPGSPYDTEIKWYQLPWNTARSLGWLDSTKTKELQEFVVFIQPNDIGDDEYGEDDEDDEDTEEV